MHVPKTAPVLENSTTKTHRATKRKSRSAVSMPVGMPLGQAMRVQEAQQASELAKSLYDFNSDDNSDAEGCSAMPEKNTSTAGKKPRLEQQLRRYKRSWGRGRVPGRQGTFHDFMSALHICMLPFHAGKVLYAPWKKGSHAPYHKDDPSLQHEEQDEKKKLRCVICMASHAERSTLIRPTCTTICKTCDVPLHVGYCYEKYHDTNTCWFVDIDAKAIYRPHENCKPNSNKKTKRQSVGPPSAESFCGSSCTARTWKPQ